MLGGGQQVGAEHYPKANLKWPVVIQMKSKEIDCGKLEALQTIIIDQDQIGSEAA